MEKKFNQIDYINKFQKERYRRYALMIPLNKVDIIKHLDAQTSKNAYIISLIEDDLKKVERN